MRWKKMYIQNVIMKKSLKAHERKRYMRIDLQNSDIPPKLISEAEKTKSISTSKI